MSSKKTDYTTYCEDAEEDSGSSVEGIESTRIYARSEVQANPYKERPNTGKSRGADKRSSNRKSDSSNTLTDSDSTPRSSKRERDARREYEREQREKDRRRKERKQKEAAEQMQRKARSEAKAAAKEREAKPARKPRPTSLTQSRTDPIVQQYRRGHVEDPSCYGVQQPAASGMRPRAQTRPNSYYPSQGPPPSMAPSGWHPAHAGQQPSGYPVGSFPPPPPLYGGGPSPSMIGVPASPARHSQGFFDMTMQNQTAHLKNRFERPASAMGFQQQQQQQQQQQRQAHAQAAVAYGYGPGGYEEEPDPRVSRRPSRSKKQTDDDRKRMPPPDFIPRPQSALPAGTPFRPPPAQKPATRQKSRPPTTRRGVGFADQQRGYEDDDLLGNEEYFTDVSPESNTYDRRTVLARTRRGSVAYEQQGLEIMPASRSRRDSFYGRDLALGGGGVSLDDDEDKYLTALAYQDDVNGGTPLALTAEALRKASHRAGGGSSRSTRSSDSRDESEYKRSNTTGITRSSSSDNDNVTIKVSGSAVVRVQGAEIECGDGGEITFSAPSGSRIGSGSDRASTVYQIEDGRSRVERKALAHRIRAPSQSDSQSRGYAQSYAPYDPHFLLDDY
ncbi:hypothetical protein BGZ61DRAFT_148884 [Ilyonectria robusta]|uniref:uncharacterized protein n=1 Tax=Ilyonectria robusta TaxID=1079257 RepID=UPI001E8D70AE|nr:uncharacterized protein BGZ61DRAFT_148884 [Ilyonectria robusta]KAH8661251.1 hypothetical protein BGZ61DRAFT_148884 [Ilyonectria robusta]